MRKLNLVLLIVLLLMVVFTIYFRQGANLRARANVAYAPISEHPELTESIRHNAATDALPQQFAEIPDDLSGCSIVNIDVVLTNVGLYDAEWLDIALEPQQGDIAVYAVTGEGGTVRARSSGQVALSLLTTFPAGTRTIRLNYYVYGMQKTITVRA